jgi:hypothetical protein
MNNSNATQREAIVLHWPESAGRWDDPGKQPVRPRHKPATMGPPPYGGGSLGSFRRFPSGSFNGAAL